MKTLVCLLEERSAMAMLEGVLPRMFTSDIDIKYITFDGKQDLEKQILRRLKGWLTPDSVFLIMRDQDSGCCVQIKNNLATKVNESGKQNQSIIRIACRELESFYLGDLAAVEQGLGIKGIAANQKKRKYRDPDKLTNPAECLENLSKNQYHKIAGSRAIGRYLNTDGSNKSHSFKVLLGGLKKLVGSHQA